MIVLPRNLDHLLSLVREQNTHQKLGKAVQIMRAEDQAHISEILPDLLDLVRLLHHASAQSDNHLRILFSVCGESPKPSVNTDIGILPDRAGIVQNEIRVFAVCHLVACQCQNSAQFFRIALIHLAAECDNAGRHPSAKLFFLLADQLCSFLQKVRLTRGAVLLGRLLFQICMLDQSPKFFGLKNSVHVLPHQSQLLKQPYRQLSLREL